MFAYILVIYISSFMNLPFLFFFFLNFSTTSTGSHCNLKPHTNEIYSKAKVQVHTGHGHEGRKNYIASQLETLEV